MLHYTTLASSVKQSDVAVAGLVRIPQVWIFIVGLNNCPPATFKQIIPSPDPELHNGKELLLPAPVSHHGTPPPPTPPLEIPQQCQNIFTKPAGIFASSALIVLLSEKIFNAKPN